MQLARSGRNLDGTSLDEMETLWKQAKVETAE
jgi:uncharacterized protein YabN with tetrapyrrole methylase and pyrophosphatase domain